MYICAQPLILMRMYEKYYAALNKGTVQYSSSASSSSLIEGCYEWYTLGRAENAPLQHSRDPQSDGVHPSVLLRVTHLLLWHASLI